VDYRGAIYGAGILWNPTPRTNVVGNWEHRFFGSSYLFSVEHRTPLSAIEIKGSRDTTSYPQQFLAIPSTGNLPLLLFFLFQTRIPDPTERLQFINQLIQDQGLPNVLGSPVNLYTQQNYLQENFSVTLGSLGARNNIFVTGFYVKSQLISGAGNPLPPIFDPQGNNNAQTGVTATWTHNLTGMMSLNLIATGVRTVANPPFAQTTRQGAVTLGLTAALSRQTTASVGARYQVMHSDVTPGYTEGAVFGGFNYTFK
jgi:uncharacterized protein (PEP-CTERM system associated)